jgi:pyridinium-3,5-bisthiocarboxylic acid mononucleotide nickel chelatase
MKILYIDPVFGISGDMMISALLDAGLPFEELQKLYAMIPLALPPITPVRTKQGIIEGTYLRIGATDIHLSITQMEEIIGGLEAGDTIKDNAKGMLNIILEAEAKVHETTRDHVHLHELASVDTLIDLLSVARGMSYFGIEKVFCGPVPLGRGMIKTAHGMLPNPPPATLEILSGCNVVFMEEPLELTTPTGASIVKHYVKDRRRVPQITVERIGYGLGAYETEKPDVLRIFVGNSAGPTSDEETWLIEADIDDMDTEYMGTVAERIRKEGALDVLYFPVYMKKGRVGLRLSVTTTLERLQHLVDVVFTETTTFGLRMRKELRQVLKREQGTVETPYGPVRIKYGYDQKGNLLKSHVEFEDVKRIAEEKAIPYRSVLETVTRGLHNKKR